MSAPSYRERLRLEGGALALFGAVACASVLVFADGATERPASTAIQLAIVAVLMATVGARSVTRSLERARTLASGEASTGEPTPVWLLAAIVTVLTLAFGFGAGWDAGLRIGGGCVIVGLAQALLFERIAARAERSRGVRFERVSGSSLFTGTKLGMR